MFSDIDIQRVRDGAKIADVIGESVKLDKKGHSLVGLCPFHQEKTPSFHVNEQKGFFYCFGCQTSGDCIGFVQQLEGKSFVDSIRYLAERYNVSISDTRSEAERREFLAVQGRTKDMFEINDVAASFYQSLLTPDSPAQQELLSRGLQDSKSTIDKFRLGFAPDDWSQLYDHLKIKGLSIRLATDLGLLLPKKSGDGYYDRFRNRLMFPVIDLEGRVVAFSGRTLGDSKAKYVNSPDSYVYQKKNFVFGLYQARRAVRDLNGAILVEGNFDVLSLSARGVPNVVAPLGTSFTSEQASKIKRFSPNVCFMFDADKAGREAVSKSRAAVSEAGLLARVASLPDGLDPDAFSKSSGGSAITELVSRSKSMIEHLIDNEIDRGFISQDPQTVALKVRNVSMILEEEKDPVCRAMARSYLDRVASGLGIKNVASFSALRNSLRSESSSTEVVQVAHETIPMEIVGAIVEYPEVAAHDRVRGLLPYLSGKAAIAVSKLSRGYVSPDKAIESVPEEFRGIVGMRLSAPKTSSLEEALSVTLNNLHKLKKKELSRKRSETVDEFSLATDSKSIDELLLKSAQLAKARREL